MMRSTLTFLLAMMASAVALPASAATMFSFTLEASQLAAGQNVNPTHGGAGTAVITDDTANSSGYLMAYDILTFGVNLENTFSPNLFPGASVPGNSPMDVFFLMAAPPGASGGLADSVLSDLDAVATVELGGGIRVVGQFEWPAHVLDFLVPDLPGVQLGEALDVSFYLASNTGAVRGPLIATDGATVPLPAAFPMLAAVVGFVGLARTLGTRIK